jgi:uncharacterized protein (TIGR02266 family)
MTQDTRKDRRAKIVSLNVRYKSATVDEFIDNHSHDVSKGGLFIKTSSPFPPGTLLKFEIRIAGDKAVIAGVGRVVWKRETSQSGPEVPAGMGVKFIKIDDASRAVIDKLVETRGEGTNAYDEGVEASPRDVTEAPAAQAPAAVGIKPVVPVGGPNLVTRDLRPAAPTAIAASSADSSSQSQAVPFRPAPSASKIPAAAGKRTMMGIGAVQDPVANAAKPAPGPAAGRPAGADPRSKPVNPVSTAIPRISVAGPPSPSSRAASSAPSTSPMFPKSNSEADMPPKNEQTVMKQAAELLEEALRGAGGSMDEIGQNPLFDVPKKEVAPVTAKDKPAVASAVVKAPGSGDGPPTMMGIGPEALKDLEKSAPVKASSAQAQSATAASSGAVATPETPTLALEMRNADIEATARSAGNDEPVKPAAKSRPIASDRPASSAASIVDAEEPKNKWLVPVALAAAAVLGFLLYTQVYAPSQVENPPTPTPSASVSSAPAASASAAAPASASAAAQPSASASGEAPSASASAAPSASASAAPAESAAATASTRPLVPVAPWHPPPPKPKPTATATAETSEKPATPPASTEGSPLETVPPVNLTPGTAAPPMQAAPVPTTTASASPKPPPKTKKQDDDNPY